MYPHEALFPETRSALLALVLLNPRRRFFLREIIRILGSGRSTVQAEVQRLTEVGILECVPEGRRLYYQANQTSPLFPSLQDLLQVTRGPVGRLRSALSVCQDLIEVSYIYGSVARYETRESSDIDLMVVGTVSFAAISDAIVPAEQLLEREINPTVYSTEEYRSRFAEGNPFLETVAAGPRMIVVGTQQKLEEFETSAS